MKKLLINSFHLLDIWHANDNKKVSNKNLVTLIVKLIERISKFKNKIAAFIK
jgi:hypothetical protein